MAELEIVLTDNYVYLLREPDSGLVAVVDPAVAEPVLDKAEELGWTITHILNTHHHGDHVGGNRKIQRATGCTIVGCKSDAQRIPGISVELEDGDVFQFGEEQAKIFFVPGHTSGHIAFWFEQSKALFIGDTIFALGCGRVVEGTLPQMWSSLDRLRALPSDTRIYCAHEYTQANARFALSVDQKNDDLKARAKQVDEMRAKDLPTVPSTMGEELATNPFLRADDPVLAEQVGLAGASPAEVFAEVRTRKDNF